MAGRLTDRMWRAARLDPRVYEEVEADTGATVQASGVVVMAAVAAGLGSGGGSLGRLLVGTLAALVGWYLWAYLIYWIGTRLLPEPGTRATHGEILRTVGFASAPGLIRVLGVVPVLRGLVFVVAGIWMLVATVVAVRQALDYSTTWRALGVSLIGWLVQALVLALVLSVLGER
jgi:hypothetical protein